jgi:hypothetical protein
MQSETRRKSLKTNARDRFQVTHFFEHPTRMFTLSERSKPKGDQAPLREKEEKP